MMGLKSRSLCFNYDLEPIREGLPGETGMHQETTDIMYQLLSEARHERDEAREQLKRAVVEIYELRKLLSKFLPSNSAETSSLSSRVDLDNRIQEILKGSHTISEAYNNYNSDDPSAANGVISRALFNANPSGTNSLALVKKSVVQDASSRSYLLVNPASKVIDNLVIGKALPQKGRFFEAILDAPLLETLMITGQLPKWQNPPPLAANLIGNDDRSLISQSQRAIINPISAIPISQIVNYKKCSNCANF
ncbi:hypothetical protein PTKIN_Ptkin13bG0277300 [Pterospermum kingtungense]